MLLLAAGRSTRIRALAGELPKPLLPLRGRSILLRNLDWLTSQGIARVTMNTHYQPHLIRAVRHSIELAYSHEEQLLGTAGAWRNLPRPERTTLLVYGDNLLRFDLEPMLRAHRGSSVSISYFDRTSHPHTGIAGGRLLVSADGYLTGFAEGTDLSEESQLVNAGVYLLDPEIWDEIPPAVEWDFARQVFPALLGRQALLRAHRIEGYCLGLDTPESFARAEQLIQAGAVRL